MAQRASVAVYGLIVAVVLIVGTTAIWAFIAKQSLVINPEPLPKVAVVTADAHSPLAAAWVRALVKAGLPATLVPLETFDSIDGVTVLCDVPSIPPRLNAALARSGGIVFAGMPPATPVGGFRLSAEPGRSDAGLKLSESASPILARLNPGGEIATRIGTVALLKESPRMNVDARWRDSARAAVMHFEIGNARCLWFGVDPALANPDDQNLLLLLRTSLRWVAGQPVSDGAVGAPQIAKALAPEARRKAHADRFAFTVDRLSNRHQFGLRMTNRGGVPLLNPTVKVWLPPGVSQVALAGDVFMRRSATLTGLPEEGACLITLPSLTRNEDRVMKLKIVEARPSVALR